MQEKKKKQQDEGLMATREERLVGIEGEGKTNYLNEGRVIGRKERCGSRWQWLRGRFKIKRLQHT